MNKQTVSEASSVSVDHTPSFRMSAVVVSLRVPGEASRFKWVQPRGELAPVVSIGFRRSTPNPINWVHGGSISGYRTLEETGRRLGGMTSDAVRDLIENGPLVGRQTANGLMVHADDLADFTESRRPRLLGVA